jgi:hypothetical protein
VKSDRLPRVCVSNSDSYLFPPLLLQITSTRRNALVDYQCCADHHNDAIWRGNCGIGKFDGIETKLSIRTRMT